MSMDQSGWIDLGGVLKCKTVPFGIVCADFIAQRGQMRPTWRGGCRKADPATGAWRSIAREVLQPAIAIVQELRQRTAAAVGTPGNVLQAALSVGGAWVG